MERIKLNLIPSGVAPVVHASQYDDGREFAIDLFEGDSVYVLDGTETLTVNVRKPDGHLVVESVTNTSDSYVVIATTEQMVAVSGTNYAKLKIEKGSVTIATLEFLMSVSRDPLENGDPSESFVSNLETQIASAVADQYDADSVVFDANPTAGHGVGFAVTSEGVKTALDNLPIPDELDDLSDVSTSSPVSGEALVWDGTKWTNGTVSTVGNLDDLSDVDTTGKAVGDSLRYDGIEWIAQPCTVALTQAEYDALQLSGDLVPNTHYVITDAPNLNPTASDIEYSGGVTVKQAIDSKALTNISVTGATGYTVSGLSGGNSLGLVGFTVEIRGSYTANSWQSVATLDTPPTSRLQVPCVNLDTGAFSGMVEVGTNGTIRVYSITSGSYAVAFTVAFKKA